MNRKLRINNRCGKLMLLVCASASLMISSSFSASRSSKSDSLVAPSRGLRFEVPDDQYIPVTRERMEVSPGYRFSSPGFFIVQVNVDSFGRNIVGDAANEPSIAVDPTNPNRIAIGWRQFDTVSSNFRQAGFGYTRDGGQTWTFPGVIEPGIFRSDPVLDSDSDGNFYYNSLTVAGNFHCNVFKSSDGGATWDAGTFAQGGDKQWMTIDKTGGLGDGNIYAFWTSAFSVCPPGYFTRSANRGFSYDDCITIPDDPFWGTLAVGPDWELYVCGVGFTDFVVAKSTNAWDPAQNVSWDTSAVVDLDGEISFSHPNRPNPGGLHGQAWVAVDRSNGPYRGNVYVLCSVERTSISDPLDVMFSRSTDGGLRWSPPVRVNDDTDTTAWQWFGTMSVAPSGRIDVVWLDTRDNPGSVNSSLYYSSSVDAGATWSRNIRLSESFNPHLGWPQQNKMGDYFDMVSEDGGAHLAWAATFNGEQDVYYSYISSLLVAIEDQDAERTIPTTFSLSQNYPNPFNPTTTIAFDLPRSGFVSLSVFTILGERIATPASGIMNAGTHTVRWNAAGLPSGVYLYRLEAGEFMQAKKLILLK